MPIGGGGPSGPPPPAPLNLGAPNNNNNAGCFNCKLEPAQLQKHHSKVAPIDLETIIDPKTGRHKVNTAGLIRESPTKSGSLDQIVFFNRNLRHENGVLEEGVFSYKYWPDHMDDQIDKIRRKAPKKIKSLLRPRAAPKKRKASPADEKEDDDKAKRQKLVLQFLDREAGAAEGDDDSSDEEMNSDNDKDIMMQHEREARAHEPGQGIDDEDEEEDFKNSALSQFLDFVLTPEHFRYVFLSHNGAKFDSVLVLNALHKKNVHVDPLFDGNKILQMRILALKITFIDTMKYLKIPPSGKIFLNIYFYLFIIYFCSSTIASYYFFLIFVSALPRICQALPSHGPLC